MIDTEERQKREKISLTDVKRLIETDIMKNFINLELGVKAQLTDNIYFDANSIVEPLKNNYVEKNIDIINSFINNYNKRISDLSTLPHIIESLKDSDLDFVHKKDNSIFLEFNFVNDLKIEIMSENKQPLGTLDRKSPTIKIYLDNIKVATLAREKIEDSRIEYVPYIDNIDDYTLLLIGLNPLEHNSNLNKINKTLEEKNENKKVNHIVNLLSVFTKNLDSEISYKYKTIEPRIKNIELIYLCHPEYVLDLKTKSELEVETLISDFKPNQIPSISKFGKEANEYLNLLHSQIREVNNGKRPKI